MQTILENQKSSVGSPYVFYNLAYEEVARTTDSVSLKFREDANLQYSSSTLGGSYWITSYVNIAGTEYAIEIKPSGQSWSGTTNHRVEKTITIPMPASQTLITNVKFRCASRNNDSGYLPSVNCSNISISLAHNPPMITNYTITETNQDLIDVGIGDEVFVANLSKKSFNILYELYDNATLLRASVYNSANQNYLSPTLPVLMDLTQFPLYTTEDGVPIYVRITDSLNSATYYTKRGVTSGAINPDFYNYIPYINTSITDSTTLARRNGQTSGRVKLNINGIYYNGVVGNIDQTSYKPIIKYKFWKAEDSEPSTYPYTIPSENVTTSNGTFNVNGYEIGTTDETAVNFFDPEFAYRVKIYVEDNFTNKESAVLSVPVGEAVCTEYKDRWDFKKITIGGNDVLESGIDNGIYYEKKADGVAICYGSVNITNADSRSQGGITYYTGAANIDLPITYTNTNNMMCFSNVALANMNRFAQSYASISSTSQIVVSYANTTQNETRPVMYLVIGKWL